MAIALRNRLFALHPAALLRPSLQPSPHAPVFSLPLKTPPLSRPARPGPRFHASAASGAAGPAASDSARIVRKVFFVPPGVDPSEVSEDMVLPGSNIVVGPYAGHAQIKEDCPKDGRPEFAILGRSNVGKSSLINALVRKKEVALTSKKPGKTQLINHFLVNKSWYFVDLPGYGFAKAPGSVRMDWSAFTKGYFLNRDTLVAVLLLIDASVPPQKMDLDCANWLGRNKIPLTLVFTKCDKMKKGKRPDENIRSFQEVIRENYREPPPWIMTSSVTSLGRDELLLHMSQLRNYWDQ
ncbi:hypothetical protein BT93_B2803 [Corymbia citriodora subsp. variegata]|nr:hypothetical protein BT93_B2803 [Corymbia citriodora subsp. variegata]